MVSNIRELGDAQDIKSLSGPLFFQAPELSVLPLAGACASELVIVAAAAAVSATADVVFVVFVVVAASKEVQTAQ